MTTRLAGNISLVLVVVSMFLQAVFQTVEAVQARISLSELRQMQEAPLQEAAKVKRQLEALSSAVAELAAGGDANARSIIDEIRREGVTLPVGKR
ncbi:MAG TPA: hypothetical protein VHU15_05420 [Stellaceae bacterium]|jgi:N-acetylglucosamine kinase-like BadF-type ATPase|nr:hypothetical protein [Stellaceae bacterium]